MHIYSYFQLDFDEGRGGEGRGYRVLVDFNFFYDSKLFRNFPDSAKYRKQLFLKGLGL